MNNYHKHILALGKIYYPIRCILDVVSDNVPIDDDASRTVEYELPPVLVDRISLCANRHDLTEAEAVARFCRYGLRHEREIDSSEAAVPVDDYGDR
jgi:hypothetical protein